MKNTILKYVAGFALATTFITTIITSFGNDPQPYMYDDRVAVEVDGKPLQITHVYEDGCLDLYDEEAGTYVFYCEE